MRFFVFSLAAVATLASSGVALAQEDPLKRKTSPQVAESRRVLDQVRSDWAPSGAVAAPFQGSGGFGSRTKSQWQNDANRANRTIGSALTDLYRQLQACQKQRDALEAQRVRLSADIGFFNDVTSLRKKDDLDRWVDEKRRKLNAERGPRIGIVNAYDGSSYYRYYDKDGALAVSVVRNSYELLKQQEADWNRDYRRVTWALESVQGDLELLREQYGELTAFKAGVDKEWRRQEDAVVKARPSDAETPSRPESAIANVGGTKWRLKRTDVVISGNVDFTIQFNSDNTFRQQFVGSRYFAGSWVAEGTRISMTVTDSQGLSRPTKPQTAEILDGGRRLKAGGQIYTRE